MQITFLERRELAPDVWEYRFTPDATVDYVPGQYARFWFPFAIDDARGKYHRTFSLVSHPSEATIRFLVRLEAPLSVFKAPLAALQPGDAMRMDEPHGDAILPRVETTPLIFVAQGIAVASYISMLHEVTTRQLAHPISLFWARRSADTPLGELLQTLPASATQYDFVSPLRVTVDDILQLNTPDSLIYLSGGQEFVETLGASLETSGIARERIIYDYYEGYTEL